MPQAAKRSGSQPWTRSQSRRPDGKHDTRTLPTRGVRAWPTPSGSPATRIIGSSTVRRSRWVAFEAIVEAPHGRIRLQRARGDLSGTTWPSPASPSGCWSAAASTADRVLHRSRSKSGACSRLVFGCRRSLSNESG